jgi:hypothetical protein
MSVLWLPPCPTDCSGAVADVLFNDCVPELHWGEISYLYIVGSSFAGFTDVTDLAEWTSNLSQTADDKIRKLTVIGELPEPELTEISYSGDRVARGSKTFNLAFEVDETNETNYNFLLMSECGGKYLIWFETSDGILYGGNDGIEASVLLNLMVPRERTALVKYMGKATWKSLKSPYRCDSPMA